MPHGSDYSDVETEIAKVALEIERYLAAHPAAADSLDGIVRWWLARQRLEESAERAQQALERLVQRRVVVMRTLPDGTVIYSSNSGKPDANA